MKAGATAVMCQSSEMVRFRANHVILPPDDRLHPLARV